ncbi:hypothetical protein C4D60_Mb08t24090 [Musa balbisiana]|uniref:Proteasome alpha-type subunits domain-containing protein n=1 Tax=Musa balbisiana TaxID=52838 RepID=A0A4S8K651_MUSBA|nr:hypothetical protein C4D60_Mb08t24090 [Musa balbisiana]
MLLTRTEYDRGGKTFSAEGRLSQVEFAIELGSTAIALKTKECVVLAVDACRYFTDPSGTFWQCNAKAIGSGSEGADSNIIGSLMNWIVQLPQQIAFPVVGALSTGIVCTGECEMLNWCCKEYDLLSLIVWEGRLEMGAKDATIKFDRCIP